MCQNADAMFGAEDSCDQTCAHDERNSGAPQGTVNRPRTKPGSTSKPSLKAIECRPEPFAAISVSHPNLRYEPDARTMLIKIDRCLAPIDIALTNLYPLPINTNGVHQMEVIGKRSYLADGG